VSIMKEKSILENRDDILRVHTVTPRSLAGFPIGIIAVDLIYPKLPGNVANATTYPFPVLYKTVSFEIEELFAGSDSIKKQIVDAAIFLEKQGVRAIVGACGYFAHFQPDVREAVDVPVFLSSLCQLQFIKTSISQKKKVAVFAASGDDIDETLLKKVGTDPDRIRITDVGGMESFAPIRYGKTTLDNEKLTADICALADSLVKEDPDVGAILLECSDLPPYARAIQSVTGLAVFDFNTMIDLVYHSVVQKSYYGFF